MSTAFRTITAVVILQLVSLGSVYGQITDPVVVNWSINTEGATGTSIDSEIDGFVSLILADVETVHYTNRFAFVDTSGVPSYNVGPFSDNNPAYPSDLDKVYRIFRNPVEDTSGNNEVVGAGPIGLLVNGVVVFNFTDARSYNNQGIWNQDANIFELDGFDNAMGHPAPIGTGTGGPNAPLREGRYHHHQNPIALRAQLGDDGSGHSPILGFAFDGFPIYGPYAFADPVNSSSDIVQIASSYQLRDISARATLADGTVLPQALHGPTLEDIELGAYQEDFFFDSASGDLDEHNGRFGVTPEYPGGTYAYFVTLNADGTSAFPHMIGVTYFGEVASQTNVTIPATAVQFVPLLLGDVNQNGAVDFLDISPFIGLLSAGSFLEEADVNQDDVVNFLDISPFIGILSGN